MSQGDHHADRIRSDRRSAARPGRDGAQERCHQHRRPQAEPRDIDDGVWLRPRPVRRVAEAADLPDLDLRLPQCGGGQAAFRGGDRQASRRRGRAGLFPLQRAQPGNPGGSPGHLGRGGGRADLFQRHGGHRHPVPVDGPAGRRHRPFRPALCRDRDADRPHPGAVRGEMARLPRRGHARGDRRGARTGGGDRSGRADLSGKPRQPDQCARGYRGGGGGTRRGLCRCR